MINVMKAGKEILDKNGIPFWLDCGTLLWAYRDGCPDPTDTDISVMEEYRDRISEILPQFYDAGFTLHKIWDFPDTGIREFSLWKDGKKFDIFMRYIDGDDAYHYATDGPRKVICKTRAKHSLVLDTLEMGGDTWTIPSDVEEYLREYYGDDWKTHKPIWNWARDAKCIQDNE